MLKSKIFKSEFSDIEIEVLETGWITVENPDEEIYISLGKPENERIRLLEEAIKYSREIIKNGDGK